MLEEYDMGAIGELKVLQRLKGRERKRTVSGSSDVEKPDKVVPEPKMTKKRIQRFVDLTCVASVTMATAASIATQSYLICGNFLLMVMTNGKVFQVS